MLNLLVNSDISKTVNLPIVMVFLNFVKKKENIFYQYTQKRESKNITIGFFIDCVFSRKSPWPFRENPLGLSNSLGLGYHS